jgi:hypothetical protein
MWRVKKNWDENKMAEIDWIQGFMKRHVYLSMRKPENTSLPRALSFNQSNVAKFYKNLQEVLFNKDFKPSNVFNIDESNMGTVLNPPKVIALKGKIMWDKWRRHRSTQSHQCLSSPELNSRNISWMVHQQIRLVCLTNLAG